MRSFYMLLIALFSLNAADAQWINQQSGTTNSLFSVRFSTDKVGYVVGGTGTILKTTDKGLNWLSQISGTRKTLVSVFPIDSNVCYVVGDSGTILKTINGGANWTQQTSGTNESLQSVSFSDSDTGIAVGTNGIVLTTTDGGQNWFPILSGTTASLKSLCFTSRTNGYMLGLPTHIYRTTDSGLHWIELGDDWIQQITYSYDQGIHSIFFTDSLNGYAVGNSAAYLQGGTYIILDRFVTSTKNTGSTWFVQHDFNCDFGTLFFIDTEKGYAVGSKGAIMRTADSGISWTAQTSGTSSSLNSVFFTDSLHGFAVGSQGTILYTHNGGTIGIKEEIEDKEISIYPNPVKTQLNIELSEMKNKSEISISDITGKVLLKQPIIDKISIIDFSTLARGLYLLKLINGKQVEMRKIIKE